ncbi:Para-nitrobenzyl esterase [Diplonema papillatum]|nr:Para-nitrobenzyl esterase [Diplonema papillatum]
MRTFATLALVLVPLVLGQTTVVQTKHGVVQGRVNNVTGSQYFFGIPFAAPPVGALRFAPPQDAHNWTGVKVLPDEPEPECAQSNNGSAVHGQEDCLTLDVYRPSNAAQGDKLPVLAWIYGGAFVLGSDDDGNSYNGQSFAAYQNVVVVAMNYRVGSLGFLALDSLFKEHNTTGNYALLDQQFGLKWISENIAAFGGDPDKVTIFGESAGGCSVVAQLAMPGSQQYFRAAIAESSMPVNDITWSSYENATAFGSLFAEHIGCGSVENQTQCLRDLPVELALEHSLDWRRLYPKGIEEVAPRMMPVIPYFPVIDGTTIPLAPIDLAAAGKFPDKPFLIGTNKNEGTVFSELTPLIVNTFPPVVFPLDKRGYDATLAHFFNASVQEKARAFYSSELTYTGAINTLIRDYMFTCPTRALLRSIQQNTPNRTQALFTYQFRPDLHDVYLGDYHSSEIPFVFNLSKPTWTPALFKLADTMHSYWASMARDGAPNCPSCPVWKPYSYNKTTDTDNFLALETPAPTNEQNLLQANCDFWDSIGYSQNP